MIAIAVVEHEGRFLIGRRPEHVPLAGLWEFPGGKQRAGETLAAAAARECREETGLEVIVEGEYLTHLESYEHDVVELHFFACRPLDPGVSLRAPFRWVHRSQLGEYVFPGGNQRLLALLRRDHTDEGHTDKEGEKLG